MPRTEEANQQIRELRRNQIINSGLHVFARKGFTDTRISDIAAESGISQGLIYRYFASKEELFATLVEVLFQLTLDLAKEAQTQPGTALEKLRWLAAQLLPYQYEQPEGALVLLHAVMTEAMPENIRQMALNYSLQAQEIVKQLVIQGQAEGQIIQRDPEQLMVIYLATFQGLAAASRFTDRPPSRMPDAGIVIQFLKA